MPQGDDYLKGFDSGAFYGWSFVSINEVADVDAEMLFTGSKTEVGESCGFGGVDLGVSLTGRAFPYLFGIGFPGLEHLKESDSTFANQQVVVGPVGAVMRVFESIDQELIGDEVTANDDDHDEDEQEKGEKGPGVAEDSRQPLHMRDDTARGQLSGTAGPTKASAS